MTPETCNFADPNGAGELNFIRGNKEYPAFFQGKRITVGVFPNLKISEGWVKCYGNAPRTIRGVRFINLKNVADICYDETKQAVFATAGTTIRFKDGSSTTLNGKRIASDLSKRIDSIDK